jgi:DNA sulfur modification protein DndD
MKIKKLILKNFMAYKGVHEIDFNVPDHSPLILFLGENGHGKTTVQHACKWCLYEETKEKNEKIPVTDLVNRKAMHENQDNTTFEMSVELEWEESGKVYNLKRTFEPFAQGLHSSKARLRIDGENPVPVSSIPDYIQRFLAKEISHFFFFDGETQDEFDKMTSNHNSAAFIRSEIEKSLSIPVITDGINWLKFKQSEESAALIKANAHNAKMQKIGIELDNARKEMQVIQEEKKKQEDKVYQAAGRIEILESEVSNIDEAQELNSEISELKGRVSSLKEKRNERLSLIKDRLGDDFWAPLANRLQELKRDITTQISKVEEEIQLSDSIRARISLLEELRKVDKCPLCNSVHEVTESKILDEINHLKSNLEDNNLTDINALKRKLVDFETFNFNFNSFIEIRNLQKEFDADGADLAVSTQKLDDKQNQLLLFGNVDILDLVTSIKSVVEDKKTAENELSQYLQDEIVLSRKITKYESDIGKGISPQKRIAHNAFSYLVNLFEEAKEDYVFLVRNQVESFASETFLKIISDKKYQGLRINDNFGVDLILPDGNLDPLRSTGQGKVSTIALVSGLIRTAMDEGFILMDTPFVSLDLGHREAVCKWAAESGFRVSLFMHSGEFVWERDRMAFGDSIGRVYRIKKISKDESTIELETA